MYNQIFERLGAKVLQFDDQEGNDLNSVENYLNVQLPNEYQKILSDYGYSIIFDNGAKYKPLKATPFDDDKGFLSLDIIYGLNGKSSIVECNKMYAGQLPPSLLTIGECMGGDQICLDKKNGYIILWKHDSLPEEKEFFELATSFEKFVFSLQADNDMSHIEGVVKSQSYLDF